MDTTFNYYSDLSSWVQRIHIFKKLHMKKNTDLCEYEPLQS